jgi:PAP2 superfamily C-terminal
MTKITWKNHWINKNYRKKFIATFFLALIMLLLMPYGFDFIQNRGGLKINDPILDKLPAFNLSIPIFILMYSLAILFIYRIIHDPNLVFIFVKAYITITVTRFILIYFIPLDPPNNLVNLVDPITNIFYGGKVITRDLFFSGHTSTMFLIFLVLNKPIDKFIALLVTFFIAIALLFQHVHYTADVLAAFPITWVIYKFVKKPIFS